MDSITNWVTEDGPQEHEVDGLLVEDVLRDWLTSLHDEWSQGSQEMSLKRGCSAAELAA